MIARVIASATQTLREIVDVLGIVREPYDRYLARTRERRLKLVGLDAGDIERKVAARIAARQAKDFAQADAVRTELEQLGVELFDSPDGTTWKKRV